MSQSKKHLKLLIGVGCLTRGGAERVASLWANGFATRGHDVTIVLNSDKKTEQTYPIDPKVRIRNIYSWCGMKMSWFFHFHYIMIWRLRSQIRKINPDVVICVLPPWAEWTRKALIGLNTPIINTEHNSFERPNGALYNPMTKELFKQKFFENKRYAQVTVLTEADKKCSDGYLSNVYVLPNPLAYDPVDVIPTKENVILAAGRLDAWYVKGFDLLIKAWGKICKKYPGWKLEIAGGGKGDGLFKLMEIANLEGTDKQLEFLGFQKDILPYYKYASIFVMPSRYEGFGMVLIEAMSQGCAPIACDYKGRQKEIITSEVEGLICPAENIDCLSDAIAKMIEDDNYRTVVQENAVKRSKNYTLDRTMERWNDIFRKIMNN